MKMRAMIAPVFLFVAVPAWAHCGKCGVGGEKGGEHAHAHAEIGKPAPEFKLLDTDAKEHKLSDFKGKTVVLEWTNHKCPMVQRYHKNTTMLNAHKKATAVDKNVVWIAVDSSSFCEEKKEGIAEWRIESPSHPPRVALTVVRDGSLIPRRAQRRQPNDYSTPARTSWLVAAGIKKPGGRRSRQPHRVHSSSDSRAASGRNRRGPRNCRARVLFLVPHRVTKRFRRLDGDLGPLGDSIRDDP